jgi:hypothetical protein
VLVAGAGVAAARVPARWAANAVRGRRSVFPASARFLPSRAAARTLRRARQGRQSRTDRLSQSQTDRSRQSQTDYSGQSHYQASVVGHPHDPTPLWSKVRFRCPAYDCHRRGGFRCRGRGCPGRPFGASLPNRDPSCRPGPSRHPSARGRRLLRPNRDHPAAGTCKRHQHPPRGVGSFWPQFLSCEWQRQGGRHAHCILACRCHIYP